MLGKVFENLLAAYNPETGTTARKQTGSFYTPREIVNYMVDEALLAYLESNLQGVQEAQTKLRQLLAYNNEPPQFTEAEKTQLITAIDNIKVLDPACGSGAFPMGALHKLVFILGKLDPDNEHWKQKQIDNTKASDSLVQEAQIKAIDEVFADNHNDYGRKLFLIENCIYGVDIQPIAVQIAKLRFFISLVVDQKTNPKKENLGIRPLPNLETKFVAANTLIGIKRADTKSNDEAPTSISPEVEEACNLLIRKLEQYLQARNPDLRARYITEAQQIADVINAGMGSDFQPLGVDWIFTTAKDTTTLKNLLPVKREVKVSKLVLRNQEIADKEQELEHVRREHFSARTPDTKRKYRDLDKRLRLEIADLLSKNHALEDEAAQQLAGWDPYNQNTHADFLDTEWMFGIEVGFDIVISNPPYLGGREWKEDGGRYYEYFVTKYEVAQYQFDIYALFWEQGINLLKDGGVISYITPNTWLNNQGSTKLRQFVLENTSIISIVDYSKEKVFSNVVVLPIVTFLKRTKSPNNVIKIYAPEEGNSVHLSHTIPQGIWASDEQRIFNIDLRENEVSIRNKIEAGNISLELLADVKFGIKIYETGKGNPPQKVSDAKKRIFEADFKVDSTYRKYLEGKDIQRYQINWQDRWLKYGENLGAPRDVSLFVGERLLVRRIVSERLICCYTDEDYVTSQLLQIVKPHDQHLAKFLLGILNSSLIAYYFRKKYNRQDKVFPEIRIYELAKLPIRLINFSDPKDKKRFDEITYLVDVIRSRKISKPTVDTTELENKVDHLVYELYGLNTEEIELIDNYFVKVNILAPEE
ncbi:MAG: TaqI-like C-terminal specificity domain-containing protein [Anaerolineales bacterium]